MTTLIRLCCSHNTEILKPLFKWKFCSKSVNVSQVITRQKFSNKCYRHFSKRKAPTNADEPLSIRIKIGIGLGTGIGVKLLQNNAVFCLDKTNTRIACIDKLEKEPSFNWRKFFKLLQSYWIELLGAILAAMICALLNIQIPRVLGHVADILSKSVLKKENLLSDMKKPILNMVGYYILQSLFTFVYIALLSRVGEGISKAMKLQMFSSVMDQDISFFDCNRSAEILNRLTVDIQDFKSSFKMVISQGLRNFTQFIGCSIALYLISPTMTGIIMIVVPTGILGGTYVGSMLRNLSYKAKAQTARVTLVAEEAISNIRTVRSFGMEDLEKQLVTQESELCENLHVKLGYGIAMFQAGTNLFLNGMVLSTISLGGYLMSTGSMTGGDLMSFLIAVQMLQRSFTQISLLFGVYLRGKHAGARVFEIIDLPPGKTLGGGRKIPYHSLMPNVEFRNVTFKYPTRPDNDILKNVNIRIPEGKTVAIVGPSGSGKSTLAWLLERFYDANGGIVLVGEEDVRQLDSNWLRKSVIGFISQEPVLFATTVMENIRYGRSNATDDEVIQAAKLADADSFIRKFPNGYQTMVGERGMSVSGGQKQRIAIARALLKNPSILILDEATSALDSESEKAVQDSLDKITQSRTTIIIAHRLSTIRNADLIIVMDNGVVVESGTHQELLSKKGMYAALVANQIKDS